MRVFLLALTFAFVLLPAMLIMTAPRRGLPIRLLWAGAAALAPLLTIGAVNYLPRFTNNAADATQFERLLGMMLSFSGFVLPWVIFAIFLHVGRRKA